MYEYYVHMKITRSHPRQESGAAPPRSCPFASCSSLANPPDQRRSQATKTGSLMYHTTSQHSHEDSTDHIIFSLVTDARPRVHERPAAPTQRSVQHTLGAWCLTLHAEIETPKHGKARNERRFQHAFACYTSPFFCCLGGG